MSASGFLGCGPPELAFQIRCGVEERNKTAASGVFFCLSPVPFSLALKAFGVRISGVVATPRKSTTYDRTVGPSYCAIIGFSFVRNSRGQWLEKLDLPSSQGSSKNNFEMFLFDEEKKHRKTEKFFRDILHRIRWKVALKKTINRQREKFHRFFPFNNALLFTHE